MYTVYKVTNLINGKIYVGVHKTNNPYDSYMGTGRLILKAINKYGIDNFSKEIIKVYDSSDEKENERLAFLLESQIVNQDFIDDENTYNLDLGGRGGIGRSKDVRKRISNTMKNIVKPPVSQETKDKISLARKGTTLSEEHKLKIGKASSGRRMSASAKNKIRSAFIGKPRTEKDKNSMREAFLKTPNKTCPYCGAECKPAPYKRWHGENCKARK